MAPPRRKAPERSAKCLSTPEPRPQDDARRVEPHNRAGKTGAEVGDDHAGDRLDQPGWCPPPPELVHRPRKDAGATRSTIRATLEHPSQSQVPPAPDWPGSRAGRQGRPARSAVSPGRQGRPATSFRQRVPHDATNSSKRRFGQGRQAAICAISRHLRRVWQSTLRHARQGVPGSVAGAQKLARRCRSDRGRWVVCRERASPNTVRLAGRATPTRGELVGAPSSTLIHVTSERPSLGPVAARGTRRAWRPSQPIGVTPEIRS